MLKTLLIVPSNISQKIYPLFLFYSITHYSYFIPFVLLIIGLCIAIDIQRNMDLMHNFVVASYV